MKHHLEAYKDAFAIETGFAEGVLCDLDILAAFYKNHVAQRPGSREILQGVHCQPLAVGGVVYAATDGHTLAWYYSALSHLSGPVVLPAGLKFDRKQFQLFLNDEQIETGKVSFRQRGPAKYPDLSIYAAEFLKPVDSEVKNGWHITPSLMSRFVFKDGKEERALHFQVIRDSYLLVETSGVDRILGLIMLRSEGNK